MARLSELIGRRVRTESGVDLGHLHDAVIGLGTGEDYPAVRVMVTRDGAEHRLAWGARSLADGSIVVDDSATLMGGELATDELSLCRDVLDVQVVDLDGHRVARVGDIVLSDDLSSPEVIAVEIGFASVLARMGLARASDHAQRRVLDWHAIHLASERGHDVQLDVPRSAIHLLDPDALAALLHRLDTDAAIEVVDAIDAETAATALELAHRTTTERILRSLPRPRAHELVGHMSEPATETWRHRLAHPRPFAGRRFFRTSGWRRHHRHEAR